MIQVNATYKPGDRPESLIRNSGGLSAKVTAQLCVISRFLLPSVVYTNHYARAAQENTDAKNYLQLIIAYGF